MAKAKLIKKLHPGDCFKWPDSDRVWIVESVTNKVNLIDHNGLKGWAEESIINGWIKSGLYCPINRLGVLTLRRRCTSSK